MCAVYCINMYIYTLYIYDYICIRNIMFDICVTELSLKLSHVESVFVKATRVLGFSNAAAGDKFNLQYG